LISRYPVARLAVALPRTHPPDDFLDRALVRLDRAACLAQVGQVDAGAIEAVDAVRRVPLVRQAPGRWWG
jgi:hypothetical protein